MAKLNTNMMLIRAEAELRRRFEAALDYSIRYGRDWEDAERLQSQLNRYRRALGVVPLDFIWRPRLTADERELAAA